MLRTVTILEHQKMREPSDKRSLSDFFFETKTEEWQALGFYARFEQVVAITVTIIISVVIVFALLALIKEVVTGLIFGELDPLSQTGFKQLFAMIMTVLIAMEFKHSIIKVAGRQESIIRVRTVILIALMALTRKLIILDVEKVAATTLAALAAALLALGLVYWMLREQERRLDQAAGAGRPRSRYLPQRRPFPGPRATQTAKAGKAPVIHPLSPQGVSASQNPPPPPAARQ